MKTQTAHLLALSLGGLVASALIVAMPLTLSLRSVRNTLRNVAVSEWYSVFPSVEMRLAKEAPPRNAQVLAELASSRAHAWDGVYRSSGTWPDELAIAPGAGFTHYEYSWCGNAPGWLAYGRVRAAHEDRLDLTVELDYPEMHASERFHLDETLYLVRWGDLRFAVPTWRMETWCAQVSNGKSFPDAPFRYLGSDPTFDFKEPPRPSGTPSVPLEFRHLLVDEPITGKIVALEEWRLKSDWSSTEHEFFDVVYSVDVGSEAKLAVGMRLFADGPEPKNRDSGRVTHVERNSARFELIASDEQKNWAVSLVGRTASTLHPDAPARTR
ncbi:MAG: hypothetical protein K8S98_02220 [Planctomycetes bacterium]|nr:hypothetical protein [Planctomycetota bacterium]